MEHHYDKRRPDGFGPHEVEFVATGSPDSHYQLGIQLLQSAGEPEAMSEALRWITLAAEQGHDGARQLLGKVSAAA